MASISDAFVANATVVADIGATYTWSANNTGLGSNASGRVTSTSTAIRGALPDVALDTAEHLAEVVVHGHDAGPMVRNTGGGTYDGYYLRTRSTGVAELYRWFSTFKASFALPGGWSLPGTLRLQVEDSAGAGSNPLLEAFWNGVSLGTYTDTLTPNTTGKYAGIHLRGTSSVLDDFVASDLFPPVAPGAPTIGTATAGDSTATANWTAPVSDGGSAIIGYKIERTVNGGSFATLVADTASTATTYVDSTAANGTAYTYRVYAINAPGTGPASSASNSVTPAAAGDVTPPSVTLVTIHGTGQVADIYDSAGYDPTLDELTVTVTAVDAESAVTAVEVNVDGAGWVAASFDTGNNWTYTIDVSAWATGDHTIDARATSTGGTTTVGAATVRHNPSGVYLRAVTPSDPCPPAVVEMSAPSPATGDFLLLETGDFLLLETGDFMLLDLQEN